MTARARRIAMLTHSYYEEDARVRREADALVAAGWEVDVFALRRPEDGPRARIGGVSVVRIPVRRHQGAGIPTYLAEYLHFFALAGWAVTRAHRRRRYALLQVHTLPDFLIFAGLPLRLSGVPLVLDLHEAMPEFFRSRFPRANTPLVHRLLVLQERASIALASAAITVNEALAARLRELDVPGGKVTVVLNSPDLRLFDPAQYPTRPFMADGELRLVYTGALTPIYELDVVLDAVARLRAERPGLPVRVDLYGRGDAEEALRARADRLGLADSVRLVGRIPLEDVPAAIADADIGLAPTRLDPFTDLSLSTKLFEYAAMGKPVVASRLRTVERYFGEGSVRTYLPGDAADLAAAIATLIDDPSARDAGVTQTAMTLAALSWDRQAEGYVGLVERLAASG